MSDPIPDIYADQVMVTIHGGGVVLTLTRLEPTSEPGPHESPYLPIARVRLGHATAQSLVDVLGKSLAQAVAAEQAAAQAAKTKH